MLPRSLDLTLTALLGELRLGKPSGLAITLTILIITRRLSHRSPRSGRRRTSLREVDVLDTANASRPPRNCVLRRLRSPKPAGNRVAHTVHLRYLMSANAKRFVYIIRSDADPSRHYTGISSNVGVRLEWHNRGPCGYTLHYRPWSLVVALEFPTEHDARRFERYLKSGSGRAFSKRHFAV